MDQKMQIISSTVENPLRIIMYASDEREQSIRRLPWSALAALEMAH